MIMTSYDKNILAIEYNRVKPITHQSYKEQNIAQPQDQCDTKSYTDQNITYILEFYRAKYSIPR